MMSFFKKEIPKEEWEKTYKKLAEQYDNNQQPFQGPQGDISLTGEQHRKIALATKKRADDAEENSIDAEKKN
ncbi:MAG: hypothetical protein WCR08_11335 [Gammaproteobacteria bacterium]